MIDKTNVPSSTVEKMRIPLSAFLYIVTTLAAVGGIGYVVTWMDWTPTSISTGLLVLGAFGAFMHLQVGEYGAATSRALTELRTEVKAEVAEVKAEVAEVKAEVAEVKAEVAEVKAEVHALSERVDTLTERVDKLESNQEVILEKLNQLLEWAEPKEDQASSELEPAQAGEGQQL